MRVVSWGGILGWLVLSLVTGASSSSSAADIDNALLERWLNATGPVLGPGEPVDSLPMGFTQPRAAWTAETSLAPSVVDWDCNQCEPWTWKVLPDGLLYRSYAAGVKEPRFSSTYLYDSERGWYWDNTLGGRVGVFRYGTPGAVHAAGWQLDMEGAVFARLTPKEKDDLDASDYRFGVPITWSDGSLSTKFGYYHISAHLGDEFLLKNPDYPRLNYVRDALLWGVSKEVTPETRVYGEAGWAFSTSGGAKPWEFHFGSEYARRSEDERRAVPFAAIHANLREEFNYDGNLNLLAGWQWLGHESGRAFRVALQYFRGKSSQYSFYEQRDRMVGGGLWFEY